MLTAVMKRMKKSEKGFTLIELLAVIVILGIIAAIAIPLIGGIINKSKTDSNLATARQIYEAARLYVVAEKNGAFTNTSVSIDSLQTNKYLDSTLIIPSTKETIEAGGVTFDGNGEVSRVWFSSDANSTGATTDTKMINYLDKTVLAGK